MVQELGITYLTPQSQPYTKLHCLAGRDQQWELYLSICLLMKQHPVESMKTEPPLLKSDTLHYPVT